jgi:hypothetical protein
MRFKIDEPNPGTRAHAALELLRSQRLAGERLYDHGQRHWVYQYTGSKRTPDYHWYIGRNGAVRLGRNLRDSLSYTARVEAILARRPTCAPAPAITANTTGTE